MTGGEGGNAGWEPVAGRFELAASVGLALVHPNGQAMAVASQRPIAALSFTVGCDCDRGTHPSRPLMVTWRQLASLEGQIQAWTSALPVNLRDQYAAERAAAEAESRKAL